MSVRRIGDRVLLALWRACVEFVEDRGHRDAAQIAFFAVLSFVPLAMLLVGGFGLFFDDEEIRRRVVEAVFENVPLSQAAIGRGSSAPSATRSTTRAGSGRSRCCCCSRPPVA